MPIAAKFTASDERSSRTAGTGMMTPPKRRHEIAGIVLLAAGLVLAGYGLYIPARVALAQMLLQRAWAATPANGSVPRPWPWAGTLPVARIVVPKHEVSLIVLNSNGGKSVPFGPVVVDGTAAPGAPGHSVVVAQGEDHFAFLRNLRIGDDLSVERPGGAKAMYVVVEKDVIDVRKQKITVDHTVDILSLVTCHPFTNWNPAAPLRYVVTAVASPAEI